MSNSITVHRERLYEDVWTTPLRRLAKQYGISDVALGKICRKLNIPRPGLGYWAKIEAGAPHRRIPLPIKADITTIEIHPQRPAPPETEPAREERLQREACIAQFADVQVPLKIKRQHPLTQRTRLHFDEIRRELRRPPRTGLGLNSAWWSQPHDKNGRYLCLPSDGFGMLVSLDRVDRALRILDTLTKGLEKYGFVLKVNSQRRKLEALKDGETTAFDLREGYKRIPLDPEEVRRQRATESWARDYEWKGSGKLMLNMYGADSWSHREWQDGKTSLEEQLPEILAEFVGYPDAIKADRAEKSRAAEKQARLARIEAQELTRIEAETKEFEQFITEAQRISALRQASAYLAILEERLSQVGVDPSGPPAAWLINMRQMIDQADPLPTRLKAIKALPKEQLSQWTGGWS